ncbi:MAG: hypothetical protein EB060_12575, partial [Proteobacteria bacterium]|nr:hypothetical protein [Pseudomonadota bacterium]
AFIGGGENNTASGDRSSVVGGMNNVAEGESSLCAGKANTASGTNSVAIGKDSVASLPSQVAISSGKFKSPGDSQTCIYQLRVQTTSSSDILMGLDGVADSSNYLEVPPGTVWFFEVSASAYDVTSVAAATWKFRGGIKNDSEFAFVGTPSSESWKDSEWDSSADLTLEAGSESQPSGLCLVATGVEGKNIYWTATVTTTELKPKPPLTSDMFVDVTADAQITSLEVSIDGSSESLFPAFDTDIQDYCIHSFANGTDSYTLTINGNTTTGTIDVNKALHVMYGAQEYFIRVLPTDLLIPTLVTKTSGYVPGYYLCSLHEATGGSYFAAFNENLVPVWYTHDDRNSTFALLCTVPNKLVLHTGSLSTRYAVELGMNEMTATNYTMQNEETNSNPIWECHES